MATARRILGAIATRYDLVNTRSAGLHRRRKARVAELTRVFASGDGKVSYACGMFGAIAPRYDLTNTVINAGLHQRWKRKAAARNQAASTLWFSLSRNFRRPARIRVLTVPSGIPSSAATSW
jgi:ubiquinone/menaquinone biosynthesis C-methylase UbiE